jgi:hypothetical protein
MKVLLPQSHVSPDLVRYEEEATLWLWASPELLGWHRQIAWLFSPVVGKRLCPGDLWGVDEVGDLIPVETKLNRGGQDSFADFVGFEAEPECRSRLCSPFLLGRWEQLMRLEREFVRSKASQLTGDLSSAGKDPGVVPYSFKRFAVRRRRRLSSPDLKSAIDALISGRPIRAAETKAFGCAIPRR